jgi:pimeloyl-ACP methyl ester carboxylesterase
MANLTVVILPVILFVLLATLVALALFNALTAARIDKGFVPPGTFVDIDGTRIHYLDRGTGPAIVIVHGLNGQLRHFTHSLLGLLTDEFRIILLDRPGAGNSARLASGAGIRAQGDLVAAFIARLALQRPLLVGHSLGGAVALAVALDHPESIRGLALIAPLTQVQTSVPAVFAALALPSAALRWLFSRTLLVALSIAASKRTLETVFGPDPVPADFGTAGGGMLSLRPDTYLAACEDLIGVRDDLAGMVARYPSLTMHVAILFGKGDRILNWQTHGESMREPIQGLRLELMEGGHMLPLTHAVATANFIRSTAAAVALA